MQWEYLGVQELQETFQRGKGHVYRTSLWRSLVPGGWLVMALNSRTNDPQPVISFYPDPDHVWSPVEPAESANLLRPAAGAQNLIPESLLRPTSALDDE